MANQEHVDLIRQGVQVWNQWRQEHPDIQPDLTNANLKGVKLRNINLSGPAIKNFEDYMAQRRSLFSGADLSGTDLSGANLGSVNFDGANLSGAALQGAYLGSATFRRASSPKAHFERAKLHQTTFEEADLSEANFEEAHLEYARFYRAKLDKVNFTRANLSGVRFDGADLGEARFYKANLSQADLIDVNLSRTDLTETDLGEAIIRNADLSHATIGGTAFGDRDFRKITGLETLKHAGPSPISITSLYLSEGNIPEVFLRGAGIPDSFITYARSLVGQPPNYYTCFISYSSQDQTFTERLYADLQSNGVRCWFALKDLKIGDKIRPRIDESIHLHNKLLLILSQHSVTSQWVEQETETALAKERKEQRTILFPIRLDNAVMEIEGGWPAFIHNTRNIGDFTRWTDPQAYQRAFERLLQDLKAETSKPEV